MFFWCAIWVYLNSLNGSPLKTVEDIARQRSANSRPRPGVGPWGVCYRDVQNHVAEKL